MRIYLDTCCLHRPLDEKSQLRVALEAEAIVGLLTRWEAEEWELVSSEVLELELDRNPDPSKRAFVASILQRATCKLLLTDKAERRAEELENAGFRALDALHLACAETGKTDVFCTCDDKLLKRARRQSDLRVKVVSPLEFVSEYCP